MIIFLFLLLEFVDLFWKLRVMLFYWEFILDGVLVNFWFGVFMVIFVVEKLSCLLEDVIGILFILLFGVFCFGIFN